MKSKILLIGVLFLMGALRVSADQEFFPFLGSINTDKVNIRAGGSTNYERMGQFSQDDEAVVVGEEYDWYKINLPQSAPMYISDQYVTSEGLVTGSKVNVRARASINATVVTKVIKGDYLDILEHQEGWYKVGPTDQSFGWVLKDFLVFKSKYIPSRDAISILQQEMISIPGEVDVAIVAESPPVEYENFQGILKPARSNADPNIQYEIVVGPDERYYIEGYGHMLDKFENFTVVIKARPKKSDGSVPVLIVKSIQLVL